MSITPKSDRNVRFMPSSGAEGEIVVNDIPWMESIDDALLQSLKRSTVFVRVLASFLRREFLPSRDVYNFWRESKLPLFLDIIGHLQTLAYASEKVTKDCFSTTGERLIVSDPFLLANGENRWDGLHAFFAGILRNLADSVEQHLSSLQIRYSMQCDELVVGMFRDARLRANEIVLLLEAWIDSFESRMEGRAKQVPLHPVFLYFSERHRISLEKAIAIAAKVIRDQSDIFTICLHTRLAALTGIYELTLGSQESVGAILDRIFDLHEDALRVFEELRYVDDENLWMHSRKSIEWRAKSLLSESGGFGIRNELEAASPKYGNATKIELMFLPSSKWLTNESSVPFEITSSQNVPARKILERRHPWDLSLNPYDSADGKASVRLRVDDSKGLFNAELATDRERSGKKPMLEITASDDQLDSHLLFAIQMLYAQVVMGTRSAEVDIDKKLKELAQRMRSQALLEVVNTSLRFCSMRSLEARDYKKMLELEIEAEPIMHLADMVRRDASDRLRDLALPPKKSEAEVRNYGFTTPTYDAVKASVWG